MKRLRRHRHEWVIVGYGGAGWSAIRCACGARDITPGGAPMTTPPADARTLGAALIRWADRRDDRPGGAR